MKKGVKTQFHNHVIKFLNISMSKNCNIFWWGRWGLGGLLTPPYIYYNLFK
jgi:hypothetical protein